MEELEQKMCRICEKKLPLKFFNKSSRSKDKLNNKCKACTKVYIDIFRSTSKQRQKRKDYRDKRKNEKTVYDREYRKKNKKKIEESKKALRYRYVKAIYDKKYKILNKEKIRDYQDEWVKNKTTTSPSFRMKKIVSASVGQYLRNRKLPKTSSTWLSLPYSPEQLKEHLESLWEPWMNWDNYGKVSPIKKTWQIDHVVPHSLFDYDCFNHPDFLKCWSLSNLRPLEAMENIRKGNRLL